MFKNRAKIFLIVVLSASTLMLTAGEAEYKAANDLLKATRFEKTMDDSINASIQMIKQMDPNMSSMEPALRKFYSKYMSAESLRKEIIDIYVDMFTEQELKDITAFYESKTGQKALDKLPEIMQRAMQIAQTRVMQHMDELKKIVSEAQSTLQER